MEPRPVRSCSLAEEIANAVTHGVGVALAIAGLSIGLVLATVRGETRHVVTMAIFGSTLVVLYAASTLYHSIPHPRARNVLRALDHSAIFLLIAGTYTPFALVSLQGTLGWILFAVIWTCALLGIVLGATLRTHKGKVTATLAVVMGWIAIVALEPLAEAVQRGGIVLIVAGGVVYTAGVAFYGSKRLPFNHAVWHLFVLGGSILHWFAVVLYVIPRG